MTTNTHADLMERHQAMQAQLANQPDALGTDTILQFLAEAQAAGATIEDVRQREQLRAILRHWGGIVFDRQGDYPAIQLVPFAGSFAHPSPPIPARPPEKDKERKEDERDEEVTPTPSRWRPLAIGVGIVFVLLILIFLGVFSGLWGSPEASATEEAVVNVVTVIITEVIIPIPPPSATPTIENGAGETGDAPKDTDDDDLSDEREILLGTDFQNADTDGDGLQDGEELTWGADPLVRDSDGDTLLDGEEVERGSSPINVDTDGDGMADNVDDAPSQPSTPTPTATPTVTPTETPLPATETATPQTAVPHTVQSGETLESIAEQYSVLVTQITELNEISPPLQVGQLLYIPLNSNFIVPQLITIVDANFRRGPGIEYNTITVKKGTFATILGQTSDGATWYLVKLKDDQGTLGWLSAAVVRLLDPARPETIPLVATVPPTPAP